MAKKQETRSRDTVARLLGTNAKEKDSAIKEKPEPSFDPNKKNITALIKKQGNSIRKADSIRLNPILQAALIYWTTIEDSSKSKPDIVEEALLKAIPEEYLIEGYNLAKRKNKI